MAATCKWWPRCGKVRGRWRWRKVGEDKRLVVAVRVQNLEMLILAFGSRVGVITFASNANTISFSVIEWEVSIIISKQ